MSFGFYFIFLRYSFEKSVQKMIVSEFWEQYEMFLFLVFMGFDGGCGVAIVEEEKQKELGGLGLFIE